MVLMFSLWGSLPLHLIQLYVLVGLLGIYGGVSGDGLGKHLLRHMGLAGDLFIVGGVIGGIVVVVRRRLTLLS